MKINEWTEYFFSIFLFISLSLFLICFPAKSDQRVQVVEYTEKSQEKQESRHVQLVREYGFHPRSKVQVVDGSVLPRKFEPFPSNMYGRPLEEIDQFIYEEVSTNLLRHMRLDFISLTCSYPIHFILLIVVVIYLFHFISPSTFFSHSVDWLGGEKEEALGTWNESTSKKFMKKKKKLKA